MVAQVAQAARRLLPVAVAGLHMVLAEPVDLVQQEPLHFELDLAHLAMEPVEVAVEPQQVPAAQADLE
jgi:hypothetical protein